MAKKASAARHEKESLRKLDQQLLELLSARAHAALGAQRDVDPLALAEWARTQNPGPLPGATVATIFRELAAGIRAASQPVKVAYLGPEYSYSHLATLERFGSGAELTPVATIAAVFEEVHRGHAVHGLVPLENSTDGRIVDTLGMFAKLPLSITGEVQLHIHHNLLGKGSRADIQEVYSKPQATSQCREWLAKHLPQARLVEMSSTTKAAELAAEKPGVAAIASRQAGAAYGLDVLAANIEDNAHNITRFAVIGGEMPPRTGHDKTALMFQILHQPGSLADTMAIFKRNKLNLTWIESFPIVGAQAEYLFFVELEGHASDLKVRRALAALQAKTLRLNVLGAYPKTLPRE
jgi:chorismate mutase/prephenate dehydratase